MPMFVLCWCYRWSYVVVAVAHCCFFVLVHVALDVPYVLVWIVVIVVVVHALFLLLLLLFMPMFVFLCCLSHVSHHMVVVHLFECLFGFSSKLLLMLLYLVVCSHIMLLIVHLCCCCWGSC